MNTSRLLRQMSVAVVVFLLASAVALSGDRTAQAVGTLDQQQTLGGFGHNIFGSQIYSQTFTAGLSGNLDQVDVRIQRVNNPGPLTVQIRTVAGGQPTAVVLTQATIPEANVPNSLGFFAVPLTPTVPVVAGTQYAIVLLAPGGDFENFHDWSDSSGNPYAGGAMFVSINNGATWVLITDQDAAFKTYVTQPPPPYDSDGDGVCNRDMRGLGCIGSDRCPGTAPGAQVDSNGCTQANVDADGDHVCNRDMASSRWCFGSDLCPGTPPATAVDYRGCSAAQNAGVRR